MKRRNVSGIYLLHKFENENNVKPTCFEDCPEERQDEFLNTLVNDGLKRTIKILANSLVEIYDFYNIKN
jgi:hypothetical protein